METVYQAIGEIKDNLKQVSSSQKDEVRIMRAMLNDSSYSVGIYDKSGKVGEYNLSKDARKMIGNIISSTTKISANEANNLADNYEFARSDAATMVNLSKEFINTYMQTGRKLSLGGREKMDVKLYIKHIDEKVKGIPAKTDSDERKSVTIPQHDTIKTKGSCPTWLK